MLDTETTIVAIASATGAAPRGIVRMSGPAAVSIAASVFSGARGHALAELENSTCVDGLIELCDAEPASAGAQRADISLPARLLLWPDRRSYTGQPAAEFHLVGSLPVLQMLVSQLCEHGATLADPGEFTMRAFLNGRLDLTQAEAVLAVIDAETDNQFDSALQQLAGGLAGPLGELRNQLISVLAELEAGLDFVEEDIEFISQERLEDELSRCHEQLQAIVQQIDERDVVAGTPNVVLIGKPNAGKSSLFNRLTGSDQAIVTDVAGTTTDFISADVHVGPLAIRLIDTAGEEVSKGDISTAAQTHRQQQTRRAELRLRCIDAMSALSLSERHSDFVQATANARADEIIVLTKADLLDERQQKRIHDWISASRLQDDRGDATAMDVLFVSSLTGDGIESLLLTIARSIAASSADSEGLSIVGSTVQRASDSLRRVSDLMNTARAAAQQQLGDEIVAAEIREALNELGLVVGAVYTDDILDLVFGRFCIGK
ncbi:MAG: GTPase [Planctomycetota bacterium]